MNIIELQKVSKSFGNYKALNDISISIEEGRIFGLLGPNGAGKTTTLRIINQIIAPDSGYVLFRNRPIQADDIYQIGYLPEERGLYRKMKVGEQALYLAQLKGLSKQEAMKNLKYWFEKLEITNWWNKKIEELSKGMAQKVQFITTILHKPSLLIFDEPFSGFDPINANMLKNEILDLKKQGATIIFSTHNMASVEELCDDIALINRSEVILQGNIHDIKQRFKKNMYEVCFSGSPNVFQNALKQANIDLIQISQEQGVHCATVSMTSNLSDNEILKVILPYVHIVAYKEILPSMDEIFIQVVQNN